jgi:hypothetical protein
LPLYGSLANTQVPEQRIPYLDTFGRSELKERLPVRARARSPDLQTKDARHTPANNDEILPWHGEHSRLEDATEKCLLEWFTEKAQNHAAVSGREFPVVHDLPRRFTCHFFAGRS